MHSQLTTSTSVLKGLHTSCISCIFRTFIPRMVPAGHNLHLSFKSFSFIPVYQDHYLLVSCQILPDNHSWGFIFPPTHFTTTPHTRPIISPNQFWGRQCPMLLVCKCSQLMQMQDLLVGTPSCFTCKVLARKVFWKGAHNSKNCNSIPPVTLASMLQVLPMCGAGRSMTGHHYRLCSTQGMCGAILI